MTATLITTCAVFHSAGPDPDEHGRVCVGHCPACHQAVMNDGSRPDEVPTPDDSPVWTCRADLQEGNPHHTERPGWLTDAMQEREGCYSNCGDEFREGGCWHDHMPLHSDCYGSQTLMY